MRISKCYVHKSYCILRHIREIFETVGRTNVWLFTPTKGVEACADKRSGLCLEQLRRVLVSGVSARIMQHEGIRRLRYSLARKSATPGTFHRETQPGRVPYLIARRFTSPYLEETFAKNPIFASVSMNIFMIDEVTLYIY